MSSAGECEGLYKEKLPMILGREAAGTVKAIGAAVSDVKVGDKVASATCFGAYAEYATVPAAQLVQLPPETDSKSAAAAILQGMTAHYLTHSTYPLKQGDTALIHAAAGGVGLLLVQMAKQLGAKVIGTVSTEQKAELARKAGADEIIIYTKQDFDAAVKKLTNSSGVNVVYDSVGKTTFEKSLNCLQPRGYLVLFGQSSGPVPPVDTQLLNEKGSLFLTRPTLKDYTATRKELLERANHVFNYITDGKLKLHIGKTFPLAEAAEAHKQLEGRKTTGKVLLIP